MQHLTLSPTKKLPPTRTNPTYPSSLPSLPTSTTKVHPTTSTTTTTTSHNIEKETENASIFFVGTATTILEWEGIRLMTDPNFLHAGDHVHLGPGVTAKRLTEPAVGIEELPAVDVVLLSHYHEDHFDRVVEDSLRRSLPIITTPHAKTHLTDAKEGEEKFTSVYAVDTFDSMIVSIDDDSKETTESRKPAFKVTAMPGEHVPPGVLGTLNDFIKAVPPTNGWMLELGTVPSSYHPSPSESSSTPDFQNNYRIYISGDTLMVDQLNEIPRRYKDQRIDLMLVHLGGTTIPSPALPLLMVTMDAEQGIQLMQLISPDVTIPVHFDDYDVFLSPLEDFRKKVLEAGLESKVVYLERGDRYAFNVKKGKEGEVGGSK